MNKVEMKTTDLAKDNFEYLATRFPECVVETLDDNGNSKKTIDFDLLKQQLSSVIVDETKERYQMTWPNKNNAIVEANQPTNKTLRPDRESSVNFDTTKNIYIEGDNIDALKILRQSYLNKIKLIYIDPPYNTGNDSFVYTDDYSLSDEEFLKAGGYIDEDGTRFLSMKENNQSDGKFHTKWLNMMYPRIKLARDLLSNDGVMFISIDNNENTNLKKICQEIFGEDKVEQYIWDTREAGTLPKTPSSTVRGDNEYLIVAYKGEKLLNKYEDYKYIDKLDKWPNPDNDPRGPWMSANISRGTDSASGGVNCFTITNPKGLTFHRDWTISEEEYKSLLADNRIFFADNGNGVPRKKIFATDKIISVQSSIFSDLKSSTSAGQELSELFDNNKVFDYPKPVELIKRIIQITTTKNDIVLDFFSGSGTSAHAVFMSSIENNKKFILVQKDENLDEMFKQSNAEGRKKLKITIDFLDSIQKPHILSEIGKERIRRAGKQIKDKNPEAKNLDIGFRCFKIDSTNMQAVYYKPDTMTQSMLDLTMDNIKPDRTSEDLLFQVMISYGIELNKTEINGNVVYIVGESLVACFDNKVDDSTITEIAKLKPTNAVFRESCFKNDSSKINLKEIFKRLSPNTKKIEVL